MNDSIEMRINMTRIPADVGEVQRFGLRTSIKIKSMQAMKRWIIDKIPEHKDITFIVAGPMPNCAACQIGMWLKGLGNVYFETSGGFRYKMDVV